MKAILLEDRKKMLDGYRGLTEHALEEMGGFTIDGWKVTSGLEP
jgi:hypothetical protein